MVTALHGDLADDGSGGEIIFTFDGDEAGREENLKRLEKGFLSLA